MNLTDFRSSGSPSHIVVYGYLNVRKLWVVLLTQLTIRLFDLRRTCVEVLTSYNPPKVDILASCQYRYLALKTMVNVSWHLIKNVILWDRGERHPKNSNEEGVIIYYRSYPSNPTIPPPPLKMNGSLLESKCIKHESTNWGHYQIFATPTGDGTATLRGHPSHAKV